MSKRRTKSKNAYALMALTLAVIVSLYKLGHTQASEALPINVDKANRPSAPNEELVCPRYTTDAPPEQILERFAYTASYNKRTRTPNWVGWVLTADHTDGTHVRRGQMFREDTDVPRPRATYDDIRESECGYQRGHICPAGDNKWSDRAQTEAFLMTNICPQNGDLNQRDWKYLEEACRDWAKRYGRVYIVAGPIFTSRSPQTVGEHRVAVPDAFFKVVLALPASAHPQALGFVYANRAGHHDMEYYVHSVDEVETMTGLDFFYQLEDGAEEAVEARSEIGEW
jgi:endonuclease G